MTENELAEKNAQFAKGVMELAFRMGYVTRDDELVRCKDCKYYRDGDCWHERENDRWIYYQSVINEPNPDDYCSRAERAEE